MKLISLNVYGGIVYEPLMKFIESHKDSTDVFCLQEMMSSNEQNPPTPKTGAHLNLLQELQQRLPDFTAHFAPVLEGYDTVERVGFDTRFGVALLVKKNINIRSIDDFFIYGSYNTFEPPDFGTIGANAIVAELEKDGTSFVVCNLHGTSGPYDKLDSPDRIEQSRRVLEALSIFEAEKIVVGDFNLLPETKSIGMFGEAGFRNLISDFDVKTTRGSLMRELFPHFKDGPYGFQEFADYTFVTPGVQVNTFLVPDARVSDHLPMILEFDVKK